MSVNCLCQLHSRTGRIPTADGFGGATGLLYLDS